MFEDMYKRLNQIDGMKLQIYAQGRYPSKKKQKTFAESVQYGDKFTLKWSGKGKPMVQQVAKWQNDGTERVKPSHWVNKLSERMFYWRKPMFEAIIEYMDKGAPKRVSRSSAAKSTSMRAGPSGMFGFSKSNPFTSVGKGPEMNPFKKLGKKIADQVGKACDRIDTTRLKKSFTFRIRK